MFSVVRKTAVLAAILLVVGLMAWSGIHNLRARRAEMQRTQEKVITLTKQTPEADSGGPDAGGVTMKGKIAPAFTLVDLGGKKVSLAQFKGHPVVVNFWATWCGPCKLEMPWFEEMNQKYKGKGLVILGLSQDDGTAPDEIAKAAKKIGVTYPILQPDDAVPKLYGGVDYLPETFYVDTKGTVVEETAGAPTRDEIEAKVKKILPAGM
jgi:thiol-disulfide isomerase/thioredoxin